MDTFFFILIVVVVIFLTLFLDYIHERACAKAWHDEQNTRYRKGKKLL